MTYLLDTNICIAYLHKNDGAVREKIANGALSQMVLCSVVRAELLYGARKSQRVEENLSLLKKFFTKFESLSFDDNAAEHYGIVYASLRSSGNLIGLNDLLIASIALANDLTVVTRNTREFIRVAGLRLEEW